jgi:hypothetical protein
MMRVDRRTEEQRHTHRWLVVATDRFMSGWGQAAGGKSVAAWACEGPTEAEKCHAAVASRKDMARVRIVFDGSGRPYRAPRGTAHFSIYVWGSTP